MKHYLTAIILFLTLSASAQSKTAAEKYNKALTLEDNGDYYGALKLLADAQKLDPNNGTYAYEEAYVLYIQKRYQQVVDALLKFKDKPQSFDKVYQLLGKCYDVMEQPAKAIAVYDDGLNRFPQSGCLNYERGLLWVDAQDHLPQALACFEKGIAGEPAYPDNYYWATKIYCNSNEAMWGIIYGELFMNLERSGDRWHEVSKLLYDTLKTHITFPEPGKPRVEGFSKRLTVMVDKGYKPSFATVYAPTLYIAAIPETEISLSSLDRIRQAFLRSYFDKHYNVLYPNALYSYQDQINKAGHFEAYNHWLFSAGDAAAFKTWKAQNPLKWQGFVKWFAANPLKPGV